MTNPFRRTIVGPPGTGKTTKIISLVQEYVSSGTDPKRIGLVTFTKVAAKVLAKRAGIGSEFVGTIHSIAFKQAGINRSQVADYEFYRDLSKKTGIEITNRNVEDNDQIELGDELLAIYQYSKAILAEDAKMVYMESHRPGSYSVFKYFIDSLESFKKGYGVIDFNDMLEMAVGAGVPDLDILFVDEAQDLSPLQWKLINYWATEIRTVIVSGDDDQAIFSWGGADPQGISKWKELHQAEQEILGQSYRVPAKVHKAAESVIRRVKVRIDKEYKPRPEEGTVRMFGDIGQLEIEHGEKCSILYRNHSLRGDIEDHLIALAVPYRVLNGKPGVNESPMAQAIKNWVTAFDDFKMFGNFRLTDPEINKMKRFMHPGAFRALKNGDFDIYDHWGKAFTGSTRILNYLSRIEAKYGSIRGIPTIQLSTIHGFKGDEDDRIILLDGMGQKTSENFHKDPDSEYRVFYVGVTRAKHQLDIVTVDNPVLVGVFDGI